MQPKPTIAGIILAAGLSRRFGALKQLQQFRGKSLVEWVLDAALGSQLDPVVLVLGYAAERIKTALGPKIDSPRIRVVVNRMFRQGQSRSVRIGLAQVGQHYPAAMFLTADQPLLTSRVIDLLIAKFEASNKSICVPTHSGRRGSPVIFGRKHYPALDTISGDTGARGVIGDNPDEVLAVEVTEPLPLSDIDTPDDLKRLMSLTRQ